MTSNKRITLSMEERLKVLDDLKTFSVSTVAKKYKVHPSTICRIKHNAPQVMKFVGKGKMQQNRRRIRPSLYDALEQNLLSWFIEKRTLVDFISNSVLRQKAKELKYSMGLPSEFKVSKGWLDGFKKRHNIQVAKVYGESASADEDSAKKFCDNFTKLLEEDGSIDEDNVYNMGETGLLWKALPSKILGEKKERFVKGYKSCKDRITVALCANASGTHKLMPLIINKYENPRALKHCKGNLPVIFKSQKSAWMTQALFCDWYQNYFKPSVRAHQLNNGVTGKVILLLDNYEGHTVPPELLDEVDFKIMYLPPNTTSLIQPMVQGIIAQLKALYRHKTIRKAVALSEINEFHKQFTLKDGIQLLHDSWMEVSADNIINSWKKIIPNQIDTYHRAMKQDLSNLTGDSYTEEDIVQFMFSCEDEERTKSIKEEDEEKQEDEEIQENTEEQENKREELQYMSVQFMSNCGDLDSTKSIKEENEEKQEDEEIQENAEEQENKREELQFMSVQFMSNCGDLDSTKSIKEENEEKQEDEEIQENAEEQENKREELQFMSVQFMSNCGDLDSAKSIKEENEEKQENEEIQENAEKQENKREELQFMSVQFMSNCGDLDSTKSIKEENGEKQEDEEIQENAEVQENKREELQYMSVQFMPSYEDEKRTKSMKEEDKEIQENTEEQENKREELQHLFQRLEQHVSQEAPFVKNIFKVLRNHFLGTDD